MMRHGLMIYLEVISMQRRKRPFSYWKGMLLRCNIRKERGRNIVSVFARQRIHKDKAFERNGCFSRRGYV